MNNSNLSTAAKILNVEKECLENFPEEIAENISSVIMLYQLKVKKLRTQLQKSLYELWTKGCACKDMEKISEETGISLEKMLKLDVQSQLVISLEYYTNKECGDSSKAAQELSNSIERELLIAQLPDAAKLLGKDCDELRICPRNTLENLCKVYREEYDENKQNIELCTKLNKIISNAKPSHIAPSTGS